MIRELRNYLGENRFVYLFYALLFMVFNPLFFPQNVVRTIVFPIAVVVLLSSSNLLFLKATRFKRYTMTIFCVFILLVSLFFTYIMPFQYIEGTPISAITNLLFLIYFAVVFIQLMREIFRDDEFDIDMIYASMSGFILLNVMSTFLFMLVEHLHPNSFKGLDTEILQFDEFLYLSFVTLTSIGYGDITPQGIWGKKMIMLTGSVGQFYLIILVGLVMSKYSSKPIEKR